jgi:hypothetical protein
MSDHRSSPRLRLAVLTAAVGALLTGVLIAGTHGGVLPVRSGVAAAFWTLTALAAVGAAVALLGPAGRGRTGATPEPLPAPVPVPPALPEAPRPDADLATTLTL